MTDQPVQQELAELVAQLKAYGRYFQDAGLEEVGPSVRPLGGIGGSSGTLPPNEQAASAASGTTKRTAMGGLGGSVSITPPERASATARADQSWQGEETVSAESSAEQVHDPEKELTQLRADIGDCTRCRLHEGRTHLVFGTGNPRARLMFVGEAPGQDEDRQGLPFVGRAGQLLTKMIESMGYRRDDVYIANVIKCRPPENRAPRPDEVAMCEPFLRRQIAAIRPEIICALGSHATQAVLRSPEKISQVRGRFFLIDGVKVLPTYHPAYLLRNPAEKKTVWEDLKKIMAVLGKASPS